MEYKAILGTIIKRLREQHDISQKELADIIGITKQSLSVFEKGTSAPSLETLIKIANHFNVSTDYLLGRTDNPEINK